MLLKFSDYLKSVNAIEKAYRGTVVNNVDPEQIGRIQVNIPGFIEGTKDSSGNWNLPWIYQKSPGMLGGAANSSSFSVPEIGNEIFVEFPYGDIYSGFYSYYWQSSATHQGFLNEDYPFSYGFRDLTGNQFKIDKAKQFLEFLHSSGASFNIDNSSNITLQTSSKIIFTSIDQKTQIIFDLSTGSMTLNANQTLNTGSQTVNHNSATQNDTIGNHNDTVTGARVTNILGGYSKAVGGDLAESILGNKVYTVAGNKSSLVAESTDETFGLDKTETVVLGNWKVSVQAGNVVIETLIGSLEMSNPIGSITISPVGEITIENEVGTISIDPLGDIAVENEVASLKLTTLGQITAENEIASIELSVAGDISAENAIASFDMSPAGEIELTNDVATIDMAISGDIKVSNVVGGALHINPAGQVALGNNIAELLDLFSQLLQSFTTNAASFVLTGVGPGALSPAIIANIAQITALLTAIKGTL